MGEFEQADKPHHIQISDTFQNYLLIPGLILLAVLGKIYIRADSAIQELDADLNRFTKFKVTVDNSPSQVCLTEDNGIGLGTCNRTNNLWSKLEYTCSIIYSILGLFQLSFQNVIFHSFVSLPGYGVYRMITLPGRKEWERKEKKRLKEEKKMKKK